LQFHSNTIVWVCHCGINHAGHVLQVLLDCRVRHCYRKRAEGPPDRRLALDSLIILKGNLPFETKLSDSRCVGESFGHLIPSQSWSGSRSRLSHDRGSKQFSDKVGNKSKNTGCCLDRTETGDLLVVR
jgi:hypothetical protein